MSDGHEDATTPDPLYVAPEGLQAPESIAATAPDASTSRRSRKALLIAAGVLVAAVAAVAIVLASRDTETEAQKLCGRLRAGDVTVLEGSNMLIDAVDSGVSITEIKAECGAMVDAIANGLGVGSLKDNVEVDIKLCNSESLKGTVKNSNSTTVDVTLRYELLGADGSTRIDDGLIFADSINPGQTVQFDEFLLDEAYDSCHVEVDSVRST